MNYVNRIYEVGEIPKLGEIPKKMYAWTLRNERLGEPKDAFKIELVDTPSIKEDEVLVFNMASGVNFNGVWAALGKPRNVINAHRKFEEEKDFLICGSESSGIVYAVGEKVTNFKVGDEVICTVIQYDKECHIFKKEKDPRVSPSFRIWGYEGNFGSYAQFSKVQETQCIRKPKKLSWAESACCTATGATVYSMLTHWKGNEIKKGDVVLIWGGAGGLGSSAIPLVKALGGIPVAIVSSEERKEYCISLGAKGCINRKNYSHWGMITEELHQDPKLYKRWLRSVMKFRKEIWDIVGEKKDPKIVIEHPGQDSLPTSIFVCDKKGMVVLCGATSGYIGSLDLRYLWLGVKRLQGAHAALLEEAEEYINILDENDIRMRKTNIFKFEEIATLNQDIYENKASSGNLAVLIGASGL